MPFRLRTFRAGHFSLDGSPPRRYPHPMPARKPEDWFACPNCGERVPARALACPECGSDDRTGWSPETETDGLDLPEPEVSSLDPDGMGRAPQGPRVAPGKTLVTAVALLIVALLVLLFLGLL